MRYKKNFSNKKYLICNVLLHFCKKKKLPHIKLYSKNEKTLKVDFCLSKRFFVHKKLIMLYTQTFIKITKIRKFVE